MAGHSKWANIKHRKARQDAKKGKAWSKCSKAIIIAAKQGGGDPDTNLTLRYAIDEAKACNMAKDTIEKAIKKGTGDLEGVDYEEIVYEGYGPNGVAVLVECLTDNRNRTAPELRKIFEKSGGKLGTSGSVAYIFEKQGQITVNKDAADEDTIMMLALDAGAEDVTDEGEVWLIVTDVDNYRPVREAIEAAELTLASAELTMVPNNTVDCTGFGAKVMSLMDTLDDHDDVQNVHSNFDIPEDELASIE